MDKLEFVPFDERFDNTPEVVKSPQSEIDDLRDEFIAENALTHVPQPLYPKNIEGLTPLNGKKIPVTRKWYRKLTSLERSGFLNIHTHTVNVKAPYWCFWIFVGWGLTNHVFDGLEVERKYHNHERKWQVYDKLSTVNLPYARVWSRPG